MVNEKGNITVLDRFETMSPGLRAIVVIVLLFLVFTILLPEVFFENKIFLAPDTKAPMSFAAIGKEALREGSYPLWNPYIFCGMPSFSSLAYTPYVYPVSFITHILSAYLHFPSMIWLLLHYLLAGFGVYLLLRSLDVRPSISTLGAVVFMLLPNYIAIGANGHGSQACSIAYMPYALLFVRYIFKGYKTILMASLLAIALGFQMLRGHVQISYYTYLLIGFLVLYELILLWLEGNKRTALFGLLATFIAVIAAIGLAAVLIFPVREYAVHSIRGGAGQGLKFGYATSWSLSPREMLTFFFPWAFGFGKVTYFGSMPFTDYPNYLGVVTVIFAFIGIFFIKHRWRWFLIICALLATLISFGKYFPLLYEPMFKAFPYFNRFRVPVMILIVQQLSIVLLMGLGLEGLLKRYSEKKLPSYLSRNTLRWIVIISVVILILVLIGSSGISSSIRQSKEIAQRVHGQWIDLLASNFVKDLIRVLLLYLAVFLLFYFAVVRRMRASTIVLILFLISLIDLFYVDRFVVHPEKGWHNDGYRILADQSAKEVIRQADASIRFFENDSTLFRIFPAPRAALKNWSYSAYPFNDSRFMVFKIFSLGGYHAAKLKIYQDVMDMMFATFRQGVVPRAILKMLNAKYFLSYYPLFKESTLYPEVYKDERFHIYENTETLPRVFLVDRYRVMNEKDALNALTDKDFDPADEVIMSGKPQIEPVSSSGSEIRITDYRINSIKMEANIDKPCIAVLSEIYYPAWKVEVDGKESNFLQADYCLRALPLDSGRHTIICRFSSPVIRRSLALSITMGVLLILVAVFSYAFIYRRSA